MLTGIDLRLLTYELKRQIEGTWIINIYHLPNNILILKVRKSGIGLMFLLIEPGKRIHLTEFNRIMPKSPSNFCKTLRNHIKDKRINSIEQRELDRVSIINIGPDEGYNLVLELFGFGNIILVSPENKIIIASRFRKMRDRDIHPGRQFVQLPAQDRDILKSELDNIEEYLTNNKKIIPALNNWLGLGPVYSRFLLKLANITKKKSEDLQAEEKTRLVEVTDELKSKLLKYDFSPRVYLEEELKPKENGDDEETQWDDEILPFEPENIIKIFPWPLKELEEDEEITKLEVDSYNRAIDVLYSSQEQNDVFSEEAEELETQAGKIEKLLNQQLTHQKEFREEAKFKRAQADALYSQFSDATELIATVYDARKKNMSWKEIKSRLELGKSKGIKSAKLLNKIDEKNATLILDIPVENGIEEVTVDFRKTLTENTNDLYQYTKKLSGKAKRAEIAIQRTRDKLEAASKISQEAVKTKVTNTRILKRRKRWYEKFHWSLFENETLVICGTDADANEKIIKRYFDDGDLFLHADLQGAATTIIKTDGREVSEKMIQFASTMAVSYSAAWKNKLMIADAFVVPKDQISLTPPSGEYLPKGSVMIYGEKKFIKHIKLELYIGLVIENNWVRLIYGPKEGIRGATCWVKIEPGDRERGNISKQIKEKFIQMNDDTTKVKIKALDISEFASIIPSNSKVIEFKMVKSKESEQSEE